MPEPASAIRIHPDDNVCVAVRPLPVGTRVVCAGIGFTTDRDLRLGAKLALGPLRRGDKVLKYGEPIGSLTADVETGGYVHTHNLASDYLRTRERGDAPAGR